MASILEIIVGTYEEFLLGYKLEINDEKSVLKQSFADKSHSGAIKCLAVQKKFVATGGTDDRIFIYDMALRKQVQILLSHEGTVNALAFTPDDTHLLSGGEDGKMLATRLNTWIAEGKWKQAHSGKAVTHISCHPSGKLALSIGGDFTLRTWNLIKGRVAYTKNLKSHGFMGTLPDNLSWSPSGEFFSLTGQRSVDFWSIKTAELVRSHKISAKPCSLCWISDEKCLVGLENGAIILKTIDQDDEEVFEAHSARVKCMALMKEFLVSACSNGIINLWKVNTTKPLLRKIATTNIGCRPTCIGLLDLSEFESIATKAVEKLEYKEQPVKFENKNKSHERGKVTIEYENDDDDEEDKSKKVVKKKSNGKSTEKEEEDEESTDDEDDDDDEDEDDDDDEEDDENSESNKNDDNEDDNDEENDSQDESEEEVVLFKPGSRKRKIRKR